MIKMDTLQKIYAGLKFKNSKTYIQSGNVVFRDTETEHEVLEKIIAKKILSHFGFEVPVVVKELAELTEVLKNNPFVNKRNEDVKSLYVTFLSQEPEQTNIDKIRGGQYASDEYILKGSTVYLFCPNGYGNTKLNNNFFESKLKVTATTRNWKTISELVNIAQKISNNKI